MVGGGIMRERCCLRFIQVISQRTIELIPGQIGIKRLRRNWEKIASMVFKSSAIRNSSSIIWNTKDFGG
jgi:hypothetical protein